MAEFDGDTERRFLVFGSAGGAGVEFGYRDGHAGLRAYYPIGGEFKFMAKSLVELVEGWCSSELSA